MARGSSLDFFYLVWTHFGKQEQELEQLTDGLIEGTLAAIFSGGGGGDFDFDFLWNGRRPDEDDDEYKRRCLMYTQCMLSVILKGKLYAGNSKMKH